MLVVDDLLLLDVLAGRPHEALTYQFEAGQLYTTASWFFRLGRAVNRPEGLGALSRALSGLPQHEQVQARAAVRRLPDRIGMLTLRSLVPVMTALETGRSLNFLTAEALAAAAVLEADVAVTTDSPLLTAAAADLGLSVRRITP